MNREIYFIPHSFDESDRNYLVLISGRPFPTKEALDVSIEMSVWLHEQQFTATRQFIQDLNFASTGLSTDYHILPNASKAKDRLVVRKALFEHILAYTLFHAPMMHVTFRSFWLVVMSLERPLGILLCGDCS